MKWTWSLAGSALLAGSVWAQSAQLENFERQLEQIQREQKLAIDRTVPPEQRMLVDFGGLLGLNFFAIDDPAQRTHILRQVDLDLFGRVNLDGAHEFYVRVLTRYSDWDPGDSFDGSGDDWVQPQIERLYYEFDLQRALGGSGLDPAYNVSLRGGRQLAQWVNGLVLSQEVDGLTSTLTLDALSLDTIVASSRPSNVDFDSSRPRFDDETYRLFVGGMLSAQVSPSHRPFIYGLVQNDQNADNFNPDPFEPFRTGSASSFFPVAPTSYEYDSYYIGLGSRGNFGDHWLYGLEFAYEGGTTLSNSFAVGPGGVVAVTQTKDPIHAFAVDARLDYLFHDPRTSRATVELLFASGDSDRLHTSNTFGGNAPGTTDRAFNGFGLINTGLAFAPAVSNLAMVRVGAATSPLPDSKLFHGLQVGADVFFYSKLEADAPTDQPTTNDYYLGTEGDLFANWQITSDLSFTTRYGVFFPAEAIVGDRDPRHFVFAGVNLAF